MQRLDLLDKLGKISVALKSEALLAITDADVKGLQAKNVGWSSDKILPLLIESKSGYDQLATIESIKPVLVAIEAPTVYETSRFSWFLKHASQSTQSHPAYYSGLFPVHAFTIFCNNKSKSCADYF